MRIYIETSNRRQCTQVKIDMYYRVEFRKDTENSRRFIFIREGSDEKKANEI